MTKTNKILFISSSQHFVDTFLKDLIKDLSKNFKVSLITKITGKSDYFDNLEIHDLPIKRKISPLADLLAIFMIIIRFFEIKPDRVVTVTPKTIIFGTFLKLIFPKVYRIHVYTGFTWSNINGFKRKIFILLDRINIFYSNKILFDSKEQIEFLMKHNFNNKNFFLINKGSIKGVDLKVFFKYNSDLKIKLKEKYQIPKKYRVILYLGRMDSNKGIYDLIESFKYLISDYSDILLLLVGKDEMNIKSYLVKINHNLKKKIIYLNHNNNPQELFNISDIFCMPSKREGFGNAVIEASACQVPVVGSDIFGLNSSLKNGKNGLTFKVSDVNDMTLKLKLLLNDKILSKTLGKNGRKFVSRNFKNFEVLKSLKNLTVN